MAGVGLQAVSQSSWPSARTHMPGFNIPGRHRYFGALTQCRYTQAFLSRQKEKLIANSQSVQIFFNSLINHFSEYNFTSSKFVCAIFLHPYHYVNFLF